MLLMALKQHCFPYLSRSFIPSFILLRFAIHSRTIRFAKHSLTDAPSTSNTANFSHQCLSIWPNNVSQVLYLGHCVVAQH